jgi:hypothetical protein
MSTNELKVKEICNVLFQLEDEMLSEEVMNELIEDVPNKNELFKILQKFLGILGLTLVRVVKNEQNYYVLVNEGSPNEKNIEDYSLLALLKVYFDELGDNQPKSEIIKLLGVHGNKLDKWINQDYLVLNGDKLSLGYNIKILFQKIPSSLLKKMIFEE